MNKKNENMSLQEATIKALYNELDDSDEIRDVEGVVDDVLVVTDPEITKDEYEEVIERAQEIVEDTPEGDLPFDEDYIGQYLQTCPICGSSFVEDHLLEPGATCPICLEQPEAFVVVGKIDSDVAVEDELGLGEDDFDVEDNFDTGNEFNLGRDESEEDITDVEPTPETEEEPNENFERSGGRRASNLGRNREVASKEIPQGNKLAESKLEESVSEIDYTKIKSAIEDLDAETQSMIGTDEGVENDYADGYKWATDICLDIVDMCKNTGEDLIESIESKKSELGTESEEMSDGAVEGATQAYDDVIGIVENFLKAGNSLNEKKLVEDEDSEFANYCQLFRKELDDAREYADSDWTFDIEGNSKNIMTLEDMGNLVSKKLANIGFQLGLVGYTFTETTDINVAKSELIDIIKNSSIVENVDDIVNEISMITESADVLQEKKDPEENFDIDLDMAHKVDGCVKINGVVPSYHEDTNTIVFYNEDTGEDVDTIVYRNQTPEEIKEYMTSESGLGMKNIKVEDKSENTGEFKSLDDLTKIDEVYLEIVSGNTVQNVMNKLRTNGFTSMTYDIEVRDDSNVKVIRTWFKEVKDLLSDITVGELSREEYADKYDDVFASNDTNKIISKLNNKVTENKIVIDNMGETYTIDTGAKTYTIKTPNGEKTFPFEKMDEFVKGYRGVNRINKPMSVIAYTDYKNGALRNWNVVGGSELIESVTVDNNAVCNINLDLTKNGKVKDTVKLAIRGIDHTTDKISRAVQTRFGGMFKSDITGKVYSQDIYVADDLWLTFMYYDENTKTLWFVLDGDYSKDKELVTKKQESKKKQ